MYDSSDYPKSLDEEVFESWLEKGRLSKIRFNYLLITWDNYENAYLPVYIENREAMSKYQRYGESNNNETVVAVYDLYSEARIC